MKYTHIYYFVLAYLFSACMTDVQSSYKVLLDRADSLCNTKPEQALSLLQTIESPIQHSEEYLQMRWTQLYYKALDKTDYHFTSDSIILPVTLYFEQHGSPAEIVEALFRLGRVYTEMHSYPQAVTTFLRCIEFSEKNNYPDSITYLYACSQLDGIYVDQYNYYEALGIAKKAYSFANKRGLMNPTYIMDVATPFAHLGMKDSTDKYYKIAFEEIIHTNSARLYSGIIAEQLSYYSFHGLEGEANTLLSVLDQIPQAIRHDSYYVAKSNYFSTFGPIDSALYYNLHIINDTLDLRNRRAATEGLMISYHKLGEYDKACQYALLYAKTVDSLAIQMQIEQTHKATNDYLSYKRISAEKDKENKALELRIIVLTTIVILIIILFVLIIAYVNHKRRFEKKQRMLAEEVLGLQEQNKLLTTKLSFASMSVNNEMLINRFKEVANNTKGTKPITRHEWDELLRLPYPSFSDEIKEIWPNITEEELSIAILVKLGFISNEIQNVTGLSRTTIYRRKKDILAKLRQLM